MSALEYEMIVAELKACDGNMARAARTLGDARAAAQYAKTLRTDFPDSEQTHALSSDPQLNPG